MNCSGSPAWSSMASSASRLSNLIELELMAELIATRSAVTIAIPAWRAARGLEDADFAERYTASAEAIVRTILETGWDESARRLGAPRRARSGAQPDLTARRAAVLGPALEPLTYEHPIQMASARGVWMTDATGAAISTLTTTCRASGTAIRESRKPRRARPGSSTRTCATCTRRRSSWPSGWPRPARTASTRSCS